MFSVISEDIGARSRTSPFTEYFSWIPQFLPISRHVQIILVVVICWENWMIRTHHAFVGKLIRSHTGTNVDATLLLERLLVLLFATLCVAVRRLFAQPFFFYVEHIHFNKLERQTHRTKPYLHQQGLELVYW
jgi:hypothetical protein